MITSASLICDRCNQHAFAILNRVSGKYECESCAPGLHAWSRHGVGTNRHIRADTGSHENAQTQTVHVGPVDLKRVARAALKKEGFGERDIDTLCGPSK
jgi:hypothetical protein